MIYFTQDSVVLNIKIGHTSGDPEGRRSALQTGNGSPLVLLATMPGEREDEARLHRQFAPHRVGGEWFRPVPALLALIGDARAREATEAAEAAPFDPVPDPAHRLRVYLAGKIDSGTSRYCLESWRDPILGGWSAGEDTSGYGYRIWDDFRDFESLPVCAGAILGAHDYVGPYFFDESRCGHAPGAEANSHGVLDSHLTDPEWEERAARLREAVGLGYEVDDGEKDWAARLKLRRLCFDAIARADVVFAWIDSADCYGTLVEIGHAHAIGRQVWIASPRPIHDLWFAFTLAEWIDLYAPSPLDAFCRAVAWDGARHAMHAAAEGRS